MWTIFIKGPIIAAITLAIFSLTGGSQFLGAALTLNLFQRRKGFNPGEGYFTRRMNDQYYGVEFNKDSEDSICIDLGILAEIASGKFDKLSGSKFDITLSEGLFLETLLIPAMEAAKNLIRAKEVIKNSHTAETMAGLLIALDTFSKAITPIVCWFEKFPKSRVKKQ